MKTEAQFKNGMRIRYNDGRVGHNVCATVLATSETGMLVQFDDRADTTPIRFSDSDWMDFISVA